MGNESLSLEDFVSTPPADQLDWSAVQFQSDPFGRLTLKQGDGAVHEAVVPVRAFPTSDPLRWISFCDAQGHELLLLESLEELNPAARAIIEQELGRREFQPQILRILEARAGSSQTDWKVVTNRGETGFATTTEESVRVSGAQGVIINDTRGIRYRIPDVRELDPVSRRILRRFL